MGVQQQVRDAIDRLGGGKFCGTINPSGGLCGRELAPHPLGGRSSFHCGSCGSINQRAYVFDRTQIEFLRGSTPDARVRFEYKRQTHPELAHGILDAWMGGAEFNQVRDAYRRLDGET